MDKPTAEELRGLIDGARDHALIVEAALEEGNPDGAKRALRTVLRFLDDPDKP